MSNNKETMNVQYLEDSSRHLTTQSMVGSIIGPLLEHGAQFYPCRESYLVEGGRLLGVRFIKRCYKLMHSDV